EKNPRSADDESLDHARDPLAVRQPLDVDVHEVHEQRDARDGRCETRREQEVLLRVDDEQRAVLARTELLDGGERDAERDEDVADRAEAQPDPAPEHLDTAILRRPPPGDVEPTDLRTARRP